jgi:phage terminase small subunit
MVAHMTVSRTKTRKIVPGPNNTAVRIQELTLKQKRFVEAYLGEANGNATEAAAIAGYEGERKSLRVIGARNLKKPSVRLAIDERTKDDGSIASREERQAFLTRVMRTEHGKMLDRLKAAELLCRMHGDFVERHKVDMTVSRKEQKAELSNFLDQLSARANAGALGPGTPIVQVIDATAESVAEVEEPHLATSE